MFNVYGIFCRTTYKVYYGSTEETIERRLSIHKNDYIRYLKGNYHYITSFEILKNGNYEIKLLETCDNKIHMIEREKFYIKSFPCVNKNIPGRTQKEYREDNKEKKKEYYEANKEKISEKNKQYHEANKEKISEKKKEYYEDNKETIKKYYEANKEKMKEYDKEYYEANREKILERMKQKYTCACGSTLTKAAKSQHEKTNKHKKYLQSL